MAEPIDFEYLVSLLDAGVIRGPVLEVGSYAWQEGDGNTRRFVTDHGLEWAGTDIESGPGVDFTLDLLDDAAVGSVGRSWQTVLVFNLLEHVYDPVAVLRNVLRLVAPGGSIVVVGPAIWELHDFPADYWRPMPDFFTEFARRHDCEVPPETFCWLLGSAVDPGSRMLPVHANLEPLGSQKFIPSRRHAEESFGKWRTLRSRGLHKVFRTYGRELWFPRAALGVVINRRP